MKTLIRLAALFAATSMLFVACKKDDGKKKDKDDDEPQEFVSLIKIDGQYDDWAALPAAKVATATCATSPRLSALKVMKVYADELYINVYFEWDQEQVTDLSWVPVHFYINADNNEATGGGAHFSTADADVMLETSIYSDGTIRSYDPGMFLWKGEPGGTSWDGWSGGQTESPWGAEILEDSGIAQGDGGNGKYEVQILREMLAGVTFADKFTIGMDIQQSWSSVGLLPNATVTEANPTGAAPKLLVTIDK